MSHRAHTIHARCAAVIRRWAGRLPRSALLVALIVPHAAINAQAVQKVTKGVRASADVTMRLYVPRGQLRISTWEKDSVDIRGTIGKTARMYGGGSLTHAKFGVEPMMAGDAMLPYANWDVTVPRGARLWVKMIEGEIVATGTTRELELYAVNGSIEVHDVAGTTSIESIDAPVSVMRASGDLRVRGSRGKVSLDSVQGTLSVATVSGPVSLTWVVAEGRVETIGGDITVKGGTLKGNTLELQSHSGAMALWLDRTRTPLLDLSSRAGPTLGDTDLVGVAKHGWLNARSFKGRITVHALAGTP